MKILYNNIPEKFSLITNFLHIVINKFLLVIEILRLILLSQI